MKKILAILILLTGCTGVQEILPGLCYSDKQGSHFCEHDMSDPDVKEEFERKKLKKEFKDLCYYDIEMNRVCPV